MVWLEFNNIIGYPSLPPESGFNSPMSEDIWSKGFKKKEGGGGKLLVKVWVVDIFM